MLRQRQARGVERRSGRMAADRAVLGLGAALQTLYNPLQHPSVVAVARPDEAAVLVLAEPVDEVDARQLGWVGLGP